MVKTGILTAVGFFGGCRSREGRARLAPSDHGGVELNPTSFGDGIVIRSFALF